ncbi:MAG: twin-arginine translocation signal domain-containing protein, partial [Dehalococcoidales bacterium]|nr:twin-arginine translocation signal domain-containing protein [Dehalococcoidales bacterium]
MELSRRDFLKASGAGVGGIFLLGALSDGVALASPIKSIPLKKKRGETPTICPYDGSGCGFIVAAQDGKVVNIEGDPDHPVNRGAACAKGASMRQLSADNPWRLNKVLYRAPGA